MVGNGLAVPSKMDFVEAFMGGPVLSKLRLYRFIGDKNFGQKNCIALNDTFLSIAAHHKKKQV